MVPAGGPQFAQLDQSHISMMDADNEDELPVNDRSGMNLDESVGTIDDFSDENSFFPQQEDGSHTGADIVDFQDDMSWGLGDGEESDHEFTGRAGQPRKLFQEYVARIRDHGAEFTHYEKASLRLMHLLRRKGATLDTYDETMRWHLAESGNNNPDAFISRQRLLKMLGKRYNVGANYLQERTVVLPSTGAKVNLIYHDARENVVSLLTDPRFGDDDFLHFDNDPLAPPPKDLDYVADINTGASYLETYKKLIKNPKKQMLVPIILYIDGAVTGQFDKLQIEALKMTLGIFNRRARDREYAWRTLGTLAKIYGVSTIISP